MAYNQQIKTETKYKLTSCYFCNEFIDNNDFKAHLETCSQALEKCPNKCQAYIQRKFMEEHLANCTKTMRERSNTDPNVVYDHEFYSLEQSVNYMRTALTEEIRQQNRLISEIETLKRSIKEHCDNQSLDLCVMQTKIEDLQNQCQEVKHWRKELGVLLDTYKNELEFRSDTTLSLEALFVGLDKTAEKMRLIQIEIENIKLRQDSRPRSMEKLQHRSDSHRCSYLETKLSEALLDVRQMKNTVHETEARCAKSEEIVADMRRLCIDVKQELADLKSHLSVERRLRAIESFDGHLIWRIDNFAAKFQEAKDYETVQRSPLFCNQQYGYTLRLDVMLNGLRRWKGRNALACLTAVEGEWDALLPRQCKLNAEIILRNQSSDSFSQSHISKTITVSQQSAGSDLIQYIYIPHRTITSDDIVRNDCIFFEVFVRAPLS